MTNTNIAELLTQTKEKTIQPHYDYPNILKKIEEQGKEFYGAKYAIPEIDIPVVTKAICYFLGDEEVAAKEGVDLEKGLMVAGPIGCGKSALMTILASLSKGSLKAFMVSCRKVSFEFSQHGYDVIGKYSDRSFYPSSGGTRRPRTLCFDDLGLEPPTSYWGNYGIVMKEVLLSRYDLFTGEGMITHLTTNLNSVEMENIYGSRLRSRMRQMFNLIAFDQKSPDKRR